MVAGGDFQLAFRAARDPGALVARMHTRGGGANRQQDSPHLPPVLLAPLFESAMSTPRRDSTQSASDEDVQQYAVRCSTPPRSAPHPASATF